MGRRITDSETGDIIAGINVTPLVDIMLVLLIIFMLVSNFITEDAIEVELPHAATGDKIDNRSVSITVSSDGEYFLSGKKVASLTLLETRLREKQTQNPKLQVIIAADRQARHGMVVDIIDLIRKLGLYNFAINVEYREEQE